MLLSALPIAALSQPIRPAASAPGPTPRVAVAGLPAAAAVSLPAPIQAAFAATGIDPANVSIRVGGVDGGIRLDHLGAQPRQVGSLIKLLTTVAALDRLGPAFRFRTDLAASPLPGSPRRWQLALHGGGDPGLRFEDLAHLLRAARAAGATRVEPMVLVDTSRFAADPGATTGIRSDPDRVGAIPPFALLVEHAAVQLTLPPGGQGMPLTDPPYPLELAVQGEAAGSACPADWPDGLQLVAQPASPAADGLPGLRLSGSWPAACPETVMLRAPLDPGSYLDLALASAGRQAGYGERLRPVAGKLPGDAPLQLHQDSRPLAELVRDINKFSNNVMARTLFLDLAAEAGEQPATPQGAARVLRGWLQQVGLAFPELVLENGAGLSHREQLSASHLEALLKYALTSSYRAELIASLPIPGEDGTLRKRFRKLIHGERLRLKSGSLDGVHAIAGYRLLPDGQAATLVCVINDPHTEGAAQLEEAVLAWALSGDSATAPAP